MVEFSWSSPRSEQIMKYQVLGKSRWKSGVVEIQRSRNQKFGKEEMEIQRCRNQKSKKQKSEMWESRDGNPEMQKFQMCTGGQGSGKD